MLFLLLIAELILPSTLQGKFKKNISQLTYTDVKKNISMPINVTWLKIETKTVKSIMLTRRTNKYWKQLKP